MPMSSVNGSNPYQKLIKAIENLEYFCFRNMSIPSVNGSKWYQKAIKKIRNLCAGWNILLPKHAYIFGKWEQTVAYAFGKRRIDSAWERLMVSESIFGGVVLVSATCALCQPRRY